MDLTTIRDAIRDVANMQEIAEDLLGLPTRTVGGRVNILCPLPGHNDRNYGSCILWKDRGHCFACNQSFDAIGLVMDTEHCSFRQAVSRISEFYGMNLDLSSDEETVKPLVIPADAFRFAGITDTAGFKKLFEEDRETAFRYLVVMIASAKKQYIAAAKDTTLPKEVSAILHHRIQVLSDADASVPEWRELSKDRPLRIK